MLTTNINYLFIIAFAILLFNSCRTEQAVMIDYANAQIEYAGRIGFSKEQGAKLYWSGSSIKINFEGESLAALIEDEKGDNYYNIILDQDSLFILYLDSTKRYYPLADGLSKGPHTIEIFKRTEWDRGKTSFYGFQIEGNAKVLLKATPYKRKIEFYGDSITAGYAVEDTSGKDSPDSTFTNNYVSYAAITARHFDAAYQCICRSGIGITISWFPLIMPEIYDRLNPTDSTSKWDFSLYNPDIVVINLFQNDSWLVNMPEFEEFKKRFGKEKPEEEYLITAYKNFLSKIRQEYPNTHIICSLGCMDATKEGSKWPAYIEKAVADLNDKKMYTHFMPYIEATAHPSIQDQETMAMDLIQFIEKTITW